MAMWDAIGIGALNWDVIFEIPDLRLLKAVDITMAPGDEVYLDEKRLTPLLNLLDQYGQKKGESGGGQAANTMLALSRMGFRTKYIGKTGVDNWGDRIIKGLVNIDTTSIKREGSSGICISLLIPYEKERSLIVFPNINNTFEARDFDEKYFSRVRCVHVTSFASPSPLSAQIEFIEKSGQEVLISFDPGSLYARLGLKALLPILRKTFLLFATEKELELMTELDHLKASRRILELGTRLVVCKQGAKGAYLLTPQRHLFFPPLHVEVKDATGAGDCFAAGFLAGILRGFDLKICGRLGTLAAAACIQGYGRESYPDQRIFDEV